MKLSKITLACALAAGVAAPQIATADDAFEFHGYARAGTAYEQDGNTTIDADGDTGNAVGRLGNEGSGGEWLFIKKFDGENGTKWDVGFMAEDWGTFAVKQSYAGASNVFASQPNAYIWAGKVFHSRMQQGLNDYYLSINDAEGAGIKGLDLGFADLELGFVTSGGGNYAATSKLSDIKFSDNVSLDLIANYGFSDNSADTSGNAAAAEAQAAWDEANALGAAGTFAQQDLAATARPTDYTTTDDAYLLVAKLSANNLVSGWNQNFYARYSDNTENNLSWGRVQGQSSVYFSTDGSYTVSEQTGIEYLASYQDFDAAEDADDRVTYNAIVRPTYQWNDIHSTWVEAGYTLVDFDDASEDNSAYKVTLSQNIAVSNVTWARPQIRLYVTAGQEKNAGVTSNPVIAGAMFEAWW